MDDAQFDNLVRRFRPGATRRRALRLLGGGVLVGTLAPALLPDDAGASAKKRCRKKEGVFMAKGKCNCALTYYSDASKFPCPHHADCFCYEGVNGHGFCGDGGATSYGCSTTADCASGSTCIMQQDGGSGNGCLTALECGTNEGCVHAAGLVGGTCQATACATPCGQ
jgi:hypothetical protein